MELRDPVYTSKGATFGDALLTMLLLAIILLFAYAIIWPQKKITVCVGSHTETQYVRAETVTADGIETVYKPVDIEVCDIRKERNMP